MSSIQSNLIGSVVIDSDPVVNLQIVKIFSAILVEDSIMLAKISCYMVAINCTRLHHVSIIGLGFTSHYVRHSNMVGSVAAHDGGKCFARVDNLLYHFSNV